MDNRFQYKSDVGSSRDVDVDRKTPGTPGTPGSGGNSIRVIIIGGSIAGLSCAHALLKSGVCRVMVLEKAKSLSAAGAGLGIDQLSCEALEDWGLRDDLFRKSKPLDIEENRAVDTERKVFVPLTKDDEFRHRAVHWSDLHRILYDSLPPGIAQFGHEATSLEINDDRSTITVSVLTTGADADDANATKEVLGDIIVAADGSMSKMRQFYWPNESRRYSGYCAWRGVLDCTTEPQVYAALKQAQYPDIGETLYFELARGTHAVLYELQGKRLNWLWYVNQPEPDLKGDSVTLHPDEETILAMHKDADRTWMPTFAKVMKLTPKPFINAIYDREPPKQLAWRRVVLVGEAAHPTTPHALRSTNMSIADAFALGKAFQKHGRNVNDALVEYETKRLSLSTKEVLFSRHLGQLKQGHLFEPKGSFVWPTAGDSLVEELKIRNMNFFFPTPS